MLNVSATQELARRLENVEAREAHLADLEQKAAELATLKQEMAEMKQMVAQLVKEGRNSKLAASSSAEGQASAGSRHALTTASLDQ